MMYIAINYDKMKFQYKHPDHNVIANLAFIEDPKAWMHIGPIDVAMFRGMTETQMQLLYRHTTEEESAHHSDRLRSLLIELAEQLPETDVVMMEAEFQAAYIENKHRDGEEGWRYVKGARIPDKLASLFAPPVLQAKLTSESIENTIRKRTTAAQPRVSAAGGQVAASAAGPAHKAVRAGSARLLIWEVADKIWKDDGNPIDKATVLNLRKRIMDVLERQHNIKRGTSSQELGNWMKERV